MLSLESKDIIPAISGKRWWSDSFAVKEMKQMRTSGQWMHTKNIDIVLFSSLYISSQNLWRHHQWMLNMDYMFMNSCKNGMKMTSSLLHQVMICYLGGLSTIVLKQSMAVLIELICNRFTRTYGRNICASVIFFRPL